MWLPSDAVAIGVGAFLGAYSRHRVGQAAAEWIASDPNKLGRYAGWHTALINVGGSFVLGGVAGIPTLSLNQPPKPPRIAPSPVSTSQSLKSLLPSSPSFGSFGLTPRAKLLLGVGFCGSFTTFSTYSVDIVQWIAGGQSGKAAAYAVTNNAAGIAAAAAGLALTRRALGRHVGR
jgi:fluoride ion exporter CrcB/FEX